MSHQIISKDLRSWMEAQSSEMISYPIKGYFPADIVFDAYEKGKKNGVEEVESEFKNQIKNRVNAMNESVFKCVDSIKSFGYNPSELYLRFTISEAKVIIVVKEEDHLSDDFIDRVYPMVYDIETKYHLSTDIPLDISFVEETEFLNRDLLRTDSFWGVYLDTGKKIFE